MTDSEKAYQEYLTNLDKVWKSAKKDIEKVMDSGQTKTALGLLAGKTFQDVEKAKLLSRQQLKSIMDNVRDKIDSVSKEYVQHSTTLGWTAEQLAKASEHVGWQQKIFDDATKSTYERLSHIFDTKYGSIKEYENTMDIILARNKQKLLDAFHREIQSTTRKLIKKDIATDVWEKEMQGVIKSGHTALFKGGRTDFGGSEELSKSAQKYLDREIKEEYGYLGNFRKDIDKANLVDISPASVEARAELYASKGQSLYQAGKVSAYEEYPNINIYWRLGIPAEHCPDCPPLAAGSPYNRDNPLPTYPGAGDTQCLTRCYCTLWFEQDGKWDGEIV